MPSSSPRTTIDDPYAPPDLYDPPVASPNVERSTHAPLLSWRVGFWVALGELTLLVAICSIEIADGRLFALADTGETVAQPFPGKVPDLVLRYRRIWFPIAAAATFSLCAWTLFRLSRHDGSRALISATLGVACATSITAPVAKLFEGYYSFDLPLGPAAADSALLACFEEFAFNLAILLFPLIIGGFVRIVGSSLKFELGIHEATSVVASKNG